MPTQTDVAVIGVGAAGLFAATWAGRAQATAGRTAAVVGLDGARKLGAKILVSGGGRCNVTHWRVDERDFAGSTPPAIRKVLGRFTVEQTIAFFASSGVAFYREADTGKLFPESDSARSILDALLREAGAAGVALHHPAKVTLIERDGEALRLDTTAGPLSARKVILCTGGKSLPKSGSDGSGFALATMLGHSITAPVVPALVPLVLPADHFIRALTGLALPCRFTLLSSKGKPVATSAGSTLCTHTGLSGPATLDISRHWLVSRTADPAARLLLDWLPDTPADRVEQLLLESAAKGALPVLRQQLTERLARQLCTAAAAPPTGDLPREARRRLVAAVKGMELPVVDDRGFTIAEATAGGVPLSEVRLDTMESRICPGLHFAGEILDVDGRIGGFNFQWAWASGFVAGTAAGR
ncbi:MAG: aminoacetone oxidase family FAD-binding enzyme [Planctomycetota bacterium]|nr:MAG: aminoacetone oxidase family FAD-binding enzyme [Planctomycetota bacterium]